MRKLLLISFSIISYYNIIYAQVGINTPVVHKNLMLHVKENSSELTGVAIPTYESLAKIIDNSKGQTIMDGTFVYSTKEKAFYFYNGNKWLILNPWKTDSTFATTETSRDKNGILQEIKATEFHTDISTKKNVIADTVKADVLEGYGSIPIGGIIMWSGDPETLPTEWKLCDHNISIYKDALGQDRKTPNLSGRFVVGYQKGHTEYGKIEAGNGSDYIKLSKENMPPHSHSPGSLNIKSSGEHNHTYKRSQSSGDEYDAFGGGNGEKAREKDWNTTSSKHIHAARDFAGETASTGGVMGMKWQEGRYITNTTNCQFNPYNVIIYDQNLLNELGAGTSLGGGQSGNGGVSISTENKGATPISPVDKLQLVDPGTKVIYTLESSLFIFHESNTTDSENYPYPATKNEMLPFVKDVFGTYNSNSDYKIVKNPKYYKRVIGGTKVCWEDGKYIPTGQPEAQAFNNRPPYYVIAYIIRIK